VLEQRIGRVHRLGQTQPVQVINFVAEGTIEEGMLSVLAFKKALFAGVLDGGEKEVFLGGSRMKKFIESVEKVTAGIPSTPPEPSPPAETETAAAVSTGTTETDKPITAATTDDPLANLLQSGLAILQQLATAAAAEPTDRTRPQQGSRFANLIETQRDEESGRTYLKLPMPEPELLQQTLQAVGTLLEGFRK